MDGWRTAGDWFVDDEGDVCAASDGALVACIVYDEEVMSLAEAKANARFIAAGPCVQTALVEALGELRRLWREMPDDDGISAAIDFADGALRRSGYREAEAFDD